MNKYPLWLLHKIYYVLIKMLSNLIEHLHYAIKLFNYYSFFFFNSILFLLFQWYKSMCFTCRVVTIILCRRPCCCCRRRRRTIVVFFLKNLEFSTIFTGRCTPCIVCSFVRLTKGYESSGYQKYYWWWARSVCHGLLTGLK